MTAIILTGPAGSGKTSAVIEKIVAGELQEFWQESWVLLPTRLQTEAFRDALVLRAGQMPLFNVRFFEVYELYDHILNLAGVPQRTMHQPATDRVLRHIIAGLELPYYQNIANKPGFVQLVSAFIRELKQGLIAPEDFEAQAQTPKDHELASIYRSYQQFLQANNLVDRDGAGWVALQCVRQDDSLARHVALLVVDGFDNFTPLQVELLNALSAQIPDNYLTLTYEAHRQQAAGQVFSRTLQRLLTSPSSQWTVQEHESSRTLWRAAALAHLERELFALKPSPLPANGALRLIEAPDPRSEVRAILRAVKRLLLAGENPESIAIVMRDTTHYANALHQTARAYGIPVAVRHPESPLHNPAVRIVLQLLDLHRLDFPRRHLLDVLRSPYFIVPDLTTEQIETLERVSMTHPIVKGKLNWQQGLAAQGSGSHDDDLLNSKDRSQRLALIDSLYTFFERVTPPSHALPRDYIAWLEALLGEDPQAVAPDQATYDPQPDHLNLYYQIRANDDAVMVRDLYALHSLRRALLDILAAYDLLADITRQGESQPIAWETFRADLELALQNRHDTADRNRAGRVLITTVFEARGLPHQHIFIPGLSEGVFPAQISEDPLYSDHERARLEAAGIPVATAADRQRDAGLFYEMCALAQQTLTLSRATIDEGGNEWTPSVFWKAVGALLTDPLHERLPLGTPPPLEAAASLREAAVALSRALNSEPSPNEWAAISWVQEQALWTNLLHGRAIERQREAFNVPFDEYSGILRQPALIDHVANLLGEARVWSASQFNDLGQCAFRFFAKRILNLERYEEPDEGFDVLQLGSLNHKILENTYRRLAGKVIAPGNLDVALGELYDEAEKVFATAPADFGFQQTPFWEQEKANILRKLERLVELDFSPEPPIDKLRAAGDDRPRLPLMQEAEFRVVEFNGAAGTLRARGYIDRIDVIGDQVVVIDYKSGSATPKNSDIQEGRNFQMLLYLLAAQRIMQDKGLPYRVRGGLFWSIQRNAVDGDLTEDNREMIEQALQQIHLNVLAARRGHFPNRPSKMENGRCVHHCEYSQFCRVNRASLSKHDYAE